MRRRITFLAAGLLAYVFGATAGAYQRYPYCGDSEVGCRVLVLVEYRQAALLHPLKAIEYLIAPPPRPE